MKKLILLSIGISLSLSVFAQAEFKPEYSFSFPFKPTNKIISTNRDYVLITDNENVALIDATNCKQKWSFTIKDKFGFKKADYCSLTETDSIFLFYTENKERKSVSLDLQTGNQITGSVKVIPDVKSEGKSEKSSFRDISHTFSSAENGVTLTVKYRAKLIVSSASSSDATLSVVCDGKYKWTQTVNAKVMRTLYSNSGMTREMADYLTAYVQGDKLFVVYDGFSVLDLASGKILWESDFDYVNFDFGLTKCTQEYPKAPFPYYENNVVYFTDMNKDVKKLRALDANSGKMIWESEQYDNDAMISNMFFVNNTIINQFGGRIFSQLYKVGMGSGAQETWAKGFSFPTDGGFKSYDAKTGKLIWSTYGKKEFDGLKKRTTNALFKDNLIFVSTEKELFTIDALSGKLVVSTPISKLDIGFPTDISLLNNNIFIQATDGYAMLGTDGKIVYATPTKEIFKTDIVGSTYVVWIGDKIDDLNSFICFDPLTGKIAGKMQDTRYPYFTSNGDAFVKFDGNKGMLRFKIN
jgi:outer membrane protein assembly factor BamB